MSRSTHTASTVLALLLPLLCLGFDDPPRRSYESPYERGDFAPPGLTREDRISNLEQREWADRTFRDVPARDDGSSFSGRGLELLLPYQEEKPKFTEAEAAWLSCKIAKLKYCGFMPEEEFLDDVVPVYKDEK